MVCHILKDEKKTNIVKIIITIDLKYFFVSVNKEEKGLLTFKKFFKSKL